MHSYNRAVGSFSILIAALLAALAALEASEAKISVEAPWARPTIGNGSVSAAYLIITNAGPVADEILLGSSPASAKVEIHTHIMDGDIARMRRLQGVDLPARKTIIFEPGGLHIMLIGLHKPLKAGDKLKLTLTFQHHPPIDVRAVVSVKPPASVRGSF